MELTRYVVLNPVRVGLLTQPQDWQWNGCRVMVGQAPTPSLAVIAARHLERNDAIVAAYATRAYSYRQIADYFGLHLASIGRIVRGQMQ